MSRSPITGEIRERSEVVSGMVVATAHDSRADLQRVRVAKANAASEASFARRKVFGVVLFAALAFIGVFFYECPAKGDTLISDEGGACLSCPCEVSANEAAIPPDGCPELLCIMSPTCDFTEPARMPRPLPMEEPLVILVKTLHDTTEGNPRDS